MLLRTVLWAVSGRGASSGSIVGVAKWGGHEAPPGPECGAPVGDVSTGATVFPDIFSRGIKIGGLYARFSSVVEALRPGKIVFDSFKAILLLVIITTPNPLTKIFVQCNIKTLLNHMNALRHGGILRAGN